MRILVTGSNGQLGNELQRVLSTDVYADIFFTDCDTLDITDAQAVKDFVSSHDLTHIINCAAYTAVDKAESDQSLCYKINADGIKNLASTAHDYGVKILHISTDYVFDGTSYRPYTETDKTNPLSAYGASKRKGEMQLLALNPAAIIIRTAWLYSPYGNNFVKTMLRLGRERDRLSVVADQIGSPTAAADLAEAIKTILLAQKWVPGIFHFTGEGVCSRYDFAKMIHRLACIDTCEVKAITTADYPTPAARPFYSVLDLSLIKRTYGIKPPYWVDSLEDCINTLKQQ